MGHPLIDLLAGISGMTSFFGGGFAVRLKPCPSRSESESTSRSTSKATDRVSVPHDQNPRPFGFPQGRLCLRKKRGDEDGAAAMLSSLDT
jgi:hypothetical protein